MAVACLGLACLLLLGSPAKAAITRSGTLHETIADDFRSGESTTHYTLKSDGKATVVRPTALVAEAGEQVVVKGDMRDDRLVGAVRATGPGQSTAIPPGARKTAVLLIAPAGSSPGPWSQESARSEVFTGTNSVNAFYQEESYGSISLTGKLREDGDVFGWFNLDTSTAVARTRNCGAKPTKTRPTKGSTSAATNT